MKNYYFCRQTRTMEGFVKINGKELKYNFLRSVRKTVTARICKDGTVEVKAPLSFSVNDMTMFLQTHHRWIEKHYDKVMQSGKFDEKKFVSGETHFYLGNSYELKVVKSDVDSVSIKDKYLIVNCKTEQSVEIVLMNWYRAMAVKKYNELIMPIIESFKKYNVAPRKVTIRDMRSRWGSCSRQGNISLNLQLIKLKEDCIRQVIVHEMCHLVYFDHQAGFYALMDKEFPEWKKIRSELKFL